jgi:small-conductance mechanosensitive channel
MVGVSRMKEMEAEDSPLSLGARVTSIVVLTLASFAIVASVYSLLVPPFTDAELQENFVDTWEAHVLGGVFVLALYCVGIFVACLGVFLGSRSRLLFSIACVAFVVACVLEFVSLELLTQRTEGLLGHGLRWLI